MIEFGYRNGQEKIRYNYLGFADIASTWLAIVVVRVCRCHSFSTRNSFTVYRKMYFVDNWDREMLTLLVPSVEWCWTVEILRLKYYSSNSTAVLYGKGLSNVRGLPMKRRSRKFMLFACVVWENCENMLILLEYSGLFHSMSGCFVLLGQHAWVFHWFG